MSSQTDGVLGTAGGEDSNPVNSEHVTVDVSEATVYSKILPHTPEAGDPYYIGDAYEAKPPAISQEWETDITHAPYLASVKSLSTAWPHLRYLADFMEVSTTPLRWKFLRTNQAERRDRSHRTNVVVLDFPSSGSPIRKNFTNANELENALRDNPENGSMEMPIRLFIVEDLSRRVIEILGARFDIDPAFFRDHVDEYSWYNIRDRWMDPPNLKAGIRQQNWTRVRFVRPRYFRTRDSFQKAREESNRFNVLRRPDDDQNQWAHTDEEAIVGLTRTKISIWVRRGCGEDRGTTGVALVDPTVKEGFPLWHGYRNWAPTPSMHCLTLPPSGPPRASLFEDLIYWTLEYPWFPSSGHNNPSESRQVLTQPMLHIACAEWHIMGEYIKARLGQIEWELGYPGQFRKDGDLIDFSLKRLHTWRRVIPLYCEMVTETIERIALFFPSHATKQTQFPDDTTSNLETILSQMKELQNRTDRLTSVVMAAISMEDSRRGLQENRNLARLTWLATIFIPLTFVTGLFSMQDDITALRLTFGWYFATAVPVTVLVLIFAMRCELP